jgi:hypothetical protein
LTTQREQFNSIEEWAPVRNADKDVEDIFSQLKSQQPKKPQVIDDSKVHKAYIDVAASKVTPEKKGAMGLNMQTLDNNVSRWLAEDSYDPDLLQKLANIAKAKLENNLTLDGQFLKRFFAHGKELWGERKSQWLVFNLNSVADSELFAVIRDYYPNDWLQFCQTPQSGLKNENTLRLPPPPRKVKNGDWKYPNLQDLLLDTGAISYMKKGATATVSLKLQGIPPVDIVDAFESVNEYFKDKFDAPQGNLTGITYERFISTETLEKRDAEEKKAQNQEKKKKKAFRNGNNEIRNDALAIIIDAVTSLPKSRTFFKTDMERKYNLLREKLANIPPYLQIEYAKSFCSELRKYLEEGEDMLSTLRSKILDGAKIEEKTSQKPQNSNFTTINYGQLKIWILASKEGQTSSKTPDSERKEEKRMADGKGELKELSPLPTTPATSEKLKKKKNKNDSKAIIPFDNSGVTLPQTGQTGIIP